MSPADPAPQVPEVPEIVRSSSRNPGVPEAQDPEVEPAEDPEIASLVASGAASFSLEDITPQDSRSPGFREAPTESGSRSARTQVGPQTPNPEDRGGEGGRAAAPEAPGAVEPEELGALTSEEPEDREPEDTAPEAPEVPQDDEHESPEASGTPNPDPGVEASGPPSEKDPQEEAPADPGAWAKWRPWKKNPGNPAKFGPPKPKRAGPGRPPIAGYAKVGKARTDRKVDEDGDREKDKRWGGLSDVVIDGARVHLVSPMPSGVTDAVKWWNRRGRRRKAARAIVEAKGGEDE